MTRGATWTCVVVGCTCLAVLTGKAWTIGTDLSKTLNDIGGAAASIGLASKLVALTADQLPGKVLPSVTQEIDDLGRVIVATADKRLAAIQADVNRTGKEFLTVADARLQKVQDQAAQVVAQVSPVITNSAALLKSLNDSIDDNYDDGRALLQSATVAATQTAQTMEYARGAAPAIIASTQSTSDSIAGIAGNIKKATDMVDRKYINPPPRTWKQKIVDGIKTGVAILVGAARIAK